MATTGKPAGTKKYVSTPVGQFEIPQGVADSLGRISNIQLVREYVEKCRNFIDPFLFQEMADRGLIHKGDFYRDIEMRLLEMEKDLALVDASRIKEEDLEKEDGLEIG